MQALVLGQPGEELSLQLVLRVVADVGLIVSITYINHINKATACITCMMQELFNISICRTMHVSADTF